MRLCDNVSVRNVTEFKNLGWHMLIPVLFRSWGRIYYDMVQSAECGGGSEIG